MTWRPTEKDEHYRRTGEVTWDCTACCLDGHEAKAHEGELHYSLDSEYRTSVLRADPCLLLDADSVHDIIHGRIDWPRFGRRDGDLLRLEADNMTVIYRITEQPYNERPQGCTPAVAEVFPPNGEFYLLEWPD